MNNKTNLPDSEKDKQKLQQDKATLDLPDVKDIPGQEHIHPPDLKEMADTTISSDDEEGIGLFGDDNKGDLTGEKFGSSSEISEDDLMADDDDLEAKLDEENDLDEDDVEVTDDSVCDGSAVTE